jgi:hypothetical protein
MFIYTAKYLLCSLALHRRPAAAVAALLCCALSSLEWLESRAAFVEANAQWSRPGCHGARVGDERDGAAHHRAHEADERLQRNVPREEATGRRCRGGCPLAYRECCCSMVAGLWRRPTSGLPTDSPGSRCSSSCVLPRLRAASGRPGPGGLHFIYRPPLGVLKAVRSISSSWD